MWNTSTHPSSEYIEVSEEKLPSVQFAFSEIKNGKSNIHQVTEKSPTSRVAVTAIYFQYDAYS
jgi:hypothetical protein